MSDEIRTADLFAGMGGIGLGFEQACADAGIPCRRVFSSEIKPSALSVLRQNRPGEEISGDVREIDAASAPDFDFLLAGFPCQAFSYAGKRRGFEDARGTLFFEVARFLKEKSPFGFLLENVEGLTVHDRTDKGSPTGRTLTAMLNILAELGYETSWKVLDASKFGVPQRRRRIYIVGTKAEAPDLEGFPERTKTVGEILERGLPTDGTPFANLLLSRYSVEELKGKSVKDKRGGSGNIHSWDLESKGPLTDAQKRLMNAVMTERRKKKWAEFYGIDWMDGMPLTIEMIESFWTEGGNLEAMLEDLTAKKYLKKEHPKRRTPDGRREQDPSLPLGYNVVAGKMSYEISEILDPDGFAPTLTASDMDRIRVVDGNGLRPLTLREGLRMFGYPEDYRFDVGRRDGFDLLGNTVAVPVIRDVSARVLDVHMRNASDAARI